MAFGLPKYPQNQTSGTADQPYGIKLQKTWDDHHVPYAHFWLSQGLCYQKRLQTHGANMWDQQQDCPFFQ